MKILRLTPSFRSPLWLSLLAVAACASATLPARAGFPSAADYPVTGRAVPELRALEERLVTFMAREEIPGGVFGLSNKGEILALRGYGWRDEALSLPMPPDALMRVASITKPVVAAAVRELIANGRFQPDTPAFDLGQDGGGVLPVNPYPQPGDDRLGNITIAHLLAHRGGWDRSEAGDLTYREIQIAEAFGAPSPPGRERTLQYILGQPLQFDPGERRSYSNIGYLTLGLIVESVTGRELLDFIHERVLGPMGVGRGDHLGGRTFRVHAHPREPFYHHPGMAPNVFDPAGPRVSRAYGGWDHEARVGQGSHITTAATLLRFLENRVAGGDDIGLPRPKSVEQDWVSSHGGSLSGTNAHARQGGDGVSFVIIFNRRHDGGQNLAARARQIIEEWMEETEFAGDN